MEKNVKRSNGWVFFVVLAVVLTVVLRGRLCSIVGSDNHSYISSCISSGVSGFGGGSTRGAGYVGRN